MANKGENILGRKKVTILGEKSRCRGREKVPLTCGRVHLKNLTRPWMLSFGFSSLE